MQPLVDIRREKENLNGSSMETSRLSDLDASWLKIHRYRIEKGKGVAYLLLSLLVLLTLVINNLYPSVLILIIMNTINGAVIWYAVWKAGFRGVRIDDYIAHEERGYLFKKHLQMPRYVKEGLVLNFTWLSYIILSGLGIEEIAFAIPFIFAFELIYFPLRFITKEDEIILNLGVADWGFVISFAAAALSTLISGVGVIGFVVVIPIWIGLGLKVLYDAPNWLESPLQTELNSSGRQTTETVKKLVSMGPLSNSSRAGILIILRKEKMATFTDLLTVTGMPKSSLRSSLDTLMKAGLISSRIAVSANDRPRTIFLSTENGEKAINEYTMLMKGL